MREKFTKADLKSGYVVKLRDGSFRMVIRAGNFTKILVSREGDWNYLNSGWCPVRSSMAVAFRSPQIIGRFCGRENSR